MTTIYNQNHGQINSGAQEMWANFRIRINYMRTTKSTIVKKWPRS